MVILPVGFTATQYPGYFWHLKEKKLYSLKGGSLRLMKLHSPNRWNKLTDGGYMISHNGIRRALYLKALSALTCSDSVVDIK